MKLQRASEWVLLLVSFGACIAWKDAPRSALQSSPAMREVRHFLDCIAEVQQGRSTQTLRVCIDVAYWPVGQGPRSAVRRWSLRLRGGSGAEVGHVTVKSVSGESFTVSFQKLVKQHDEKVDDNLSWIPPSTLVILHFAMPRRLKKITVERNF
jgi:hypothetical protein